GLPLRLQIGKPRTDVADLSEEDREFIESLSLRDFLDDGATDGFESLLVLLRERNRVQLPQRFDLRIVERLDESMAVVRLVSKIVLQLFQLFLELGQDERILIDRGDLLVDSGEGFLRAGLFLAQLSDQVGAVREPGQFAGDSSNPFLQTSFVPEGTERGVAIDVRS